MKWLTSLKKRHLERKEANLLREAIDLDDIAAFEIMTPRVDVLQLPLMMIFMN